MTLHVSNKMLRVAAIAAATALALSACGKSEDKAGQQGGAAAGQQAPAPEVRVVTVHPQQVTISTDLPGRLESFRSAGVRAQVGGIIKKRLFQEGRLTSLRWKAHARSWRRRKLLWRKPMRI